jgi:hypothetical protein
MQVALARRANERAAPSETYVSASAGLDQIKKTQWRTLSGVRSTCGTTLDAAVRIRGGAAAVQTGVAGRACVNSLKRSGVPVAFEPFAFDVLSATQMVGVD